MHSLTGEGARRCYRIQNPMQWFQLQLINMNQRHTFFNAHPTENMTVLSNQLSNEDFTPSNGLYDLLMLSFEDEE